MTTATQVYTERDAASVHTRLIVAGVQVSGVTTFRNTFSRGEVPVLRVDLATQPPASVVERAPVTFDVGLGGPGGGPGGAIYTRRFTGTVDSVSSDELGDYLECVGKSRDIEAPFQSFIKTITNQESNPAVEDIMGLAGVTDYDVDLPIWQIGTVAPQTIEHATFGAAINKIALPFGRAPWKELPSGRIVVKQEDPIPATNAFRLYYSARAIGNVETQPDGVGNVNARPRIYRIAQAKFPREIRNKVTVIGAIVTTVIGPDEPSDTIKGISSASSPFIKTPPTYYSKEIECELLDKFVDAAASAQGWLSALNRLETQVPIEVEGDPEIALGMTVQLIDLDYARVTGNWFVESYTEELTEGGYTTTMLLRGGQGAGSGGQVEPFADFTWTKQLQVTEDGPRLIVTFTSLSQDYDGTIVSYAWLDNATVPNAGTGPRFTVAYDYSVDGPTIEMTLTVIDNDGLTDDVTKVVTIQSDTDPTLTDSQGQVTLGFIADAAKLHGQASIDGADSWNDLTKAAMGVTGDIISVEAWARPLDSQRIILWGTASGEIARSTDDGLTGTQVLDLGFGRIESIERDSVRDGLVYAGTSDGRIYRSTDWGLTWALYKQFGDGFPILQVIAPEDDDLWAVGGDTGDPDNTLIRVEIGKAGVWSPWLIVGPPLSTAIALAGAGFAVKRVAFYDGLAISLMFNGGVDPLVWFNADVVADPDNWQPAVGIDPGVTAGHALASGVDPYDTIFIGDSLDTYHTRDGINYDQEVGNTPSQINHLLAERGLKDVFIGAADDGIVKSFDFGTTWGYLRPNSNIAVPTTWLPGDIGYQVAFERYVGPQAIAGEYTLLLIHRGVTRTMRLLSAGPSWAVVNGTPDAGSNDLRWLPIADRVVRRDATGYSVGSRTDYVMSAGTMPTGRTNCIDLREDPVGRWYMITEDGGVGNELWWSDNADAGPWTSAYSPGNDFDFYAIGLHPTDPDMIILDGKNAPASLGARMHVSIDRALSFIVRNPSAAGAQQTGEDFRPCIILQTGRIIATTIGINNCIISYSDDLGVTFTTAFTGVFTHPVVDLIAAVNYNPIFALLRQTGGGAGDVLLRSLDLGVSYAYVPDPGWGDTNFKSLAYDAITDTLFVHVENTTAGTNQVWALSPSNSTDASDWTDITYDLPAADGALAGNFQKLVVVPKI